MNIHRNIRLVILDRDGVINTNSKRYIQNPAEWQAITGSLEAIAELKAAGFLVAVATNQSGIGRKYYGLTDLKNIHEKMLAQLAQAGGSIDAIEFCSHAPEEKCNCRKPAPGMLHAVAKRLNILPNQSIYIGDSLKDLQAARNYGCQGYLVRTGYGEATLKQLQEQKWKVPFFDDLRAAVRSLVR